MKMKKHWIISLILIFMVVFTLFAANISSSKHSIIIEEEMQLKSSVSLDKDMIFVNVTDHEIISMFETINFTVDTSDFIGTVAVNMKISFLDGTSELINMARIGSTENYTTAYTPEYNTPTGNHSITFYIYDGTSLLNDQKTKSYVIVKSNYYCVDFNQINNGKGYYLNDTLYASIIVKNVNGHIFTYEVDITNGTGEHQKVVVPLADNIEWFNITIDESDFTIVNKEYYVRLTLENQTGTTRRTYFPFKVLNFNPDILKSTLELSSNSIFRSEEDNCKISVNITDVETASENLTVYMLIYNPQGLYINNLTLSPEGNNFTTDFHINIQFPVGTYRLNITAVDTDNGWSSIDRTFIVKNNLPEIHRYKINGKSMQESIAVFYGDWIKFHSFNFTDVEGDNNIEYVIISLINELDQWYNISSPYSAELEIKIRSTDLPSGVWYVYMTIIDSDGGKAILIDDMGLAPQEIRIIPDLIGEVIPWLSLILGILFGLAIGVALGYKILKIKRDTIQKPTKKKQTLIKKQSQKPKKPKMEKIEKPIEEPEIEEEKEVKQVKKKIKRRL